MSKGMKTAALVVAGLGLLGVAAFGYLKMAGTARLVVPYFPHNVDIPVPMPLTENELAELRAERLAAVSAPLLPAIPPTDEDAAAPTPEVSDPVADAIAAAEAAEPVDVLASVDLDAIALSRARARGEHLVEARYACVECHGRDFQGGTMVDDGAMGTWLGPNLTGGEGSPVADYTVSDWDHIVRHGVKKNGRAAVMPSEDYVGMSDSELSDIVAYITSLDPVDKKVPAPTFGPIGTLLLGNKALPLSAESHASTTEHPADPPAAAVTVEFGKHLSQVCTGCHGSDLAGGTIDAGPPSWPKSRNLTPHDSGLKGWTYDQFKTAMIDGKRPDGSDLLEPMTLMKAVSAKMTPTELEALFVYLQSLEPLPTGD